MRAALRRDLAAVRQRDPAARSDVEIMLCYPGLHALWGYRVSHWLWTTGHGFAGRLVAACVRTLTGVDIHPGAVIGAGLFIDHATGVVVGETTVIGDDVTIYQGVTLGGRSLEPGKRHPTIEDRVIVGAGAKVLGPLVVGHDSRIGANAVVVHDVPPDSVVVGVPGQVVARSRHRTAATPLDLDATALPDVVGAEIASLQERVEQLERELTGHITVPEIRPSAAGVWRGEDFSI